MNSVLSASVCSPGLVHRLCLSVVGVVMLESVVRICVVDWGGGVVDFGLCPLRRLM